MLPGQLVDLSFQQRDPFRKIWRGHIDLLQDLAVIYSNSTQTRMAYFTGALEQVALLENQALCKRIPVVGKNMDDLITVGLNLFAGSGCGTGLTVESSEREQKYYAPAHSS